METYAATNGGAQYNGPGEDTKDTMREIMSAVIGSLLRRDTASAHRNYDRLIAQIRERGYQGKDIRFAKGQISELLRYERGESGKSIVGIINNFLYGLPKPQDLQRRLSPRVHRGFSGIGYLQYPGSSLETHL